MCKAEIVGGGCGGEGRSTLPSHRDRVTYIDSRRKERMRGTGRVVCAAFVWNQVHVHSVIHPGEMLQIKEVHVL